MLLGSLMLRQNLPENTEPISTELTKSVKAISKNLAESAKKIEKASSSISESYVRSVKKIKKFDELIKKSTLISRENYGQTILNSLGSTVKILNTKKNQLQNQIEEKKLKLKDLEDKSRNKEYNNLFRKELFRIEKLENEVVEIQNKIFCIQNANLQHHQKEQASVTDMIKIIQESIQDNSVLRQSLNEMQVETAKLKKTLLSKISEAESLENSLNVSYSKFKGCKEENQKLRVSIETIKNRKELEVSKLKQNMEIQKTTINELQKLIHDLEMEIKSLKDDFLGLQKENETLKLECQG